MEKIFEFKKDDKYKEGYIEYRIVDQFGVIGIDYEYADRDYIILILRDFKITVKLEYE